MRRCGEYLGRTSPRGGQRQVAIRLDSNLHWGRQPDCNAAALRGLARISWARRRLERRPVRSRDAHLPAAVMFSVATAARWQINVGIGRRADYLRGKRKPECDQQRDGEHSAKHAFEYSEGLPVEADDQGRMPLA